MPRALVLVSLLAACSGGSDDPDPPDPPVREHHARFVGLWAVEQPTHALYEVTYYDLRADGTVGVGPSVPADCTGHLERHCVTGSVARCVPAQPGERCEADLTCTFGETWWSLGANRLVIVGDCADGVAREIAIDLRDDASANSEWSGAGGTLVTVGGEAGWSHDNWEWGFRKCPAGTGPDDCYPP